MSDPQWPAVPGIIKAAVILTFFNTWVLFEETVVDRYGLWEYMPYYRVAKLCSWDIGALALIIWGTLWTSRRYTKLLVVLGYDQQDRRLL